MRLRTLNFFCLAAALIASPFSNALAEGAPPRYHKSWDIWSGLPDNQVKDIIQTRDGYLWLATRSGLARFDGNRFAIFNQANTPVFTTANFWSLAEDVHGGILACSWGGLYSFSNGRFTRLGLKSGLTADWVNYAIESASSGLW